MCFRRTSSEQDSLFKGESAMMGRRISRRTALKGLGTAIALPFLDAMLPSVFASPGVKAAAQALPETHGVLLRPQRRQDG